MAGRRGDPIRPLYAGPAGRLTQRNTLYKRLSSPLRGAIFLPLRSTPFPVRPSAAGKCAGFSPFHPVARARSPATPARFTHWFSCTCTI